MQGNEGERGSLRERRQMEESDSFNSLKVSLERQGQKERGSRQEGGMQERKKDRQKERKKTTSL